MRINLKLSDEEKQSILENHNIFRKVILEKKRNQIIVEGIEDEKKILRKALKTCVETKNSTPKELESGKAALFVANSSKDDPSGNYAKGDMILYFADKGSDAFSLLAKSKNPTTKKVKSFDWFCYAENGTKPIDLYATQEMVAGDVQKQSLEGWVEWEQAQGFDFSQEGVTYAKKTFSDGTTRYKDLKSERIQSGATAKQKEIINYVNQIYGSGSTAWSFVEPTQSLGWQKIIVPDPKNQFPEKIYIWVSPEARRNAKTITTTNIDVTKGKTKLTNDECQTEIQKYFDLYIEYENEPNTINTQEFPITRANVKRCRISFCGTGSLYCESGNRYRGLGNEYDRYIDFFMGRKKLQVGRKEYNYLIPGHPFRID